MLLRMNQHSLGRGRGSEGRGEGGEKGAALIDGNFFDKVLPCGSIKSFSPAPFPLPRLEARATPATRKPRAQAGSGRTSAHAPRGRYMAATSPAPEPRTRHNAGVWLLVLGPHGSGSPGTACGGSPWVWRGQPLGVAEAARSVARTDQRSRLNASHDSSLSFVSSLDILAFEPLSLYRALPTAKL